VPAAATGIVGLKPTRGRISTAGVVPACASLDCVSVFARSVEEAAEAAGAAAGFDPADPWSRRPGATPAVDAPRIGRAPGLDVPGVDVDLEPFLAAGALLYEGAFVAERYAAVGEFVASGPDGLDPVVASIILAASDLPAWQLARDHAELERLRRRTEPVWEDVDVLVVPSVPRIPTLAEVAADPIGANAALGTYTNFVNLLDLCALTVPVGPASADAPPPSVTLIAPAWADHLLVAVAADLGRTAPAGSRSA
jgi:allophanate hydrolase